MSRSDLENFEQSQLPANDEEKKRMVQAKHKNSSKNRCTCDFSTDKIINALPYKYVWIQSNDKAISNSKSVVTLLRVAVSRS